MAHKVGAGAKDSKLRAMTQKLEIGHPLKLVVTWYDNVPVPKRQEDREGEVIGWRESQVVVRVKDYAVIRFWKKHGREVGNPDHERRGWRIDTAELNNSAPKGVEVDL
jgi:hypothetical protein